MYTYHYMYILSSIRQAGLTFRQLEEDWPSTVSTKATSCQVDRGFIRKCVDNREERSTLH